MLLPRIIPCLLLHKNGLVKTIQFKNPKYVGDPINAVKIFNDKQVDELIFLDIDATKYGTEPNYKTIANLAVECRMPFCYGGGIKTVEQALNIFSLGVEKIAIGSKAIENPVFITKIAMEVGSQSVVVVLDIRLNKVNRKYEIFTHNGTISSGLDPVVFSSELRNLGAGEILINSIDNDGMMNGYDLELIYQIRNSTSLPLTVLGGAGSLNDIAKVISEFGIIGVAAGSYFVFKGKFNAVLLNYPSQKEKEMIYNLLKN